MYLDLKERSQHTGRETFGVEFEIREQDDLYDHPGLYVKFEFRPETVRLLWERRLENGTRTPWERKFMGVRADGSCVTGPRVLKNGSLSDSQTGYWAVFEQREVGGTLTKYALLLPTLAETVELWETTKLPE